MLFFRSLSFISRVFSCISIRGRACLFVGWSVCPSFIHLRFRSFICSSSYWQHLGLVSFFPYVFFSILLPFLHTFITSFFFLLSSFFFLLSSFFFLPSSLLFLPLLFFVHSVFLPFLLSSVLRFFFPALFLCIIMLPYSFSFPSSTLLSVTLAVCQSLNLISTLSVVYDSLGK